MHRDLNGTSAKDQTSKRTQAKRARLRIGCVSDLRPNKIPAKIQQMAFTRPRDVISKRERPNKVSRTRAMAVKDGPCVYHVLVCL